jgi:glucose 1-dehydrogenase
VLIVARRDLGGCQETIGRIKENGGQAAYLLADVSRSRDANRIIAASQRILGGLDILVNNAGLQLRASFLESTPHDWDRVFATNTKSVFLCSQSAARAMIARGTAGRIINVASHAGLAYIDGLSPAYQASKAAVIHLTRILAVELAPHSIRVNALAPGLIETRFTGEAVSDPIQRRQLEALIPLARIGRPEEVGTAAAFLASSDAAMMTGQTLVLNGGRTL